MANKSMATVTTTVTGYNIKPAPLAAEKVTSFMTTSCDYDEGRKTAELVRKSSSSSAPRSCSKDETPQHSHFVVVTIGVQLEEHGSYFKVALINLLSSRFENSKYQKLKNVSNLTLVWTVAR